MNNQHPITPPPELVELWTTGACAITERGSEILFEVALQAARWGADQELEACCEALYKRYVNTGLLPATAATVSQEMRNWLRTARRPKLPSLKQQALAELGDVYDKDKIDDTTYDTIRKALEALPND